METTFLVIFTLLFLFFQRYGASSSNTMITTSSNVSCTQKERDSLLVFIQDFMGEYRPSTWTGVECCMWVGVGCDMRNGRVVTLDFRSCQLTGSIPASIGQLSMLKGIDFSDNQLNGSIPASIGRLSRLEVLYLDGNLLSGSIPTSIGRLSRLEELHLYNNLLSGSIPTSIGRLSRLSELHLYNNRLSGNIPTSLGQLSNLRSLMVFSNSLVGNIPTSLGQLSNLQSLVVHNNSLAGVLSEIHFTKLSSLDFLTLSHNSLTLNLSSHWIPPFQLLVLDASHINVGPQFPNFIQTSKNLERLSLSNSSIRDMIPEWFDNISSHISFLDLSYNQIGGKLPRFDGYTYNWNERYVYRYLNMRSNKFEGSFTSLSNVEVLDLSDNLLSGNVPRIDGTTNPRLTVINLSRNRFTGSIPANLCKVLSVKFLDLSHNNFSGILPECLGSLIDLRVFDLADNAITGDVPDSLGSLSYLKSFHLHNNKFEGILPSSLQNLTRLVTMDLGNNLLSGSIPSWIGKKLSSLRILNLQSNKFTGKIPLQLCQINTLQYLNLANNSITGTVPRCFCNLTGMIMSSILNFSDYDTQYYEEYIVAYIKGKELYYEEYILSYMKGLRLKYTKTIGFLISLDLSNNNIIGEIPNGLMNLAALTNLNLSRNLLSGQIPPTIGHLKSMESLDLSMNKLFGRIPPGLASLNFLSYLNLSFNKLSGRIPGGNQLQTFDDPAIYEGNNGLCGFPLLRGCNNLSYTHVCDDEGKDGIEGLWFYTGMVSGFIVGFVGLIGSLLSIRIWRVAYFKTIENVCAWLMVSILVTLARLRRKFF